jgi:hypothetical protein
VYTRIFPQKSSMIFSQANSSQRPLDKTIVLCKVLGAA